MTAAGLPANWRMTTLGEIARQKPNNGIFRKNPDYLENGSGGLPVVWVKELFDGNSIDTRESRRVAPTRQEVEKYGLKKGDILFCRSSLKRDGIAFNNVYLGEDNAALFECHLIRISLEQKQVLPVFLNWMLRTPLMRAVAKSKSNTATMTTIDQPSLASIPIPLPPLAEQKRIAGILDAADALRAKRRESLAQLDTLLQSSFLDMFGDPVTNPMGWDIQTLGHLAENEDGKRVPVKKADRERMAGAYPYYGASGIIDSVDDYLFDGERLLIGEDGANLVARSTPIAFIAKGKYWVNNHAHVLAFNGKSKLVYLEAMINSIDLKGYLSGTAQPKLNQKSLNRIPIPTPPLDLQHRFAAIVESIEQQKASQRAYLDELDTLFASLQSRAFRGDL